MIINNPTEFPSPAIPAVNGAASLVDGEIRHWTGAMTSIESPMQLHLGDLASLSAPEVLAALAAAKKAWNRGLGAWPTSHPNERIAAMEQFVGGMRAKVKELATMLCFEIAKPYKDAEKEITRT